MSAQPSGRARLQTLLREAAGDGFSSVEREGLGRELRDACAAWLETLPEPHAMRPELEHFSRGLDAFEARGRTDKSRVVAHGLRICATADADEHVAKPKRAAKKTDLGRETKRRAPRGSTAAKSVSRSQAKAQAPATRASAEPSGPAPDDPNMPARFRSPATLKGIGPKTAEKLAARGLRRLEDLAFLLPLGYLDRRRVVALESIAEGEEGVVIGTVKSYRSSWFRRRFSARMGFETEMPDGSPGPRLEARWFHPVSGLQERAKVGTRICLAGVVKDYKGTPSMVHPHVFDVDAGAPGITVRYPVVEGVGPVTVQRAVRNALAAIDAAGGFEEVLPDAVRAEYDLPGQFDALMALHAPDPDIDDAGLRALIERRSPAHRRLAFDEFFFLQLALLAQRRDWVEAPGPFTRVEPVDRERLRAALPFEPTGAQWRVIEEIENDLATPHPMLRLVQGDVGSGKTAVAFAAALAVCSAGGQVALMAPTGILANQHLRTLSDWCEKAGLRVALLTGATPRAQRTSTLALLAAGEIDVLVGTHALIYDAVDFDRLGLVIVDEQHRFGVEQRAALRHKGHNPHLLVMTATPIPRSLALTAFGELEVSVIDELPPGREAPTTKLFTGKRGLAAARKCVAEAVRKQLPGVGSADGEGARAFVVCPLVEASEAVDASDVDATAAAMRELLPELDAEQIVVVHGRMSAAEKDSRMEAFRSGAARVLVATTVIEVGVDVPEATYMLIEHAERFGLAQLHQLRGRIGRGQGASTCLLHTASGRASDAGRRLEVMEQHHDGFVVAEKDLEFRGPGEVFGTRQSGVPKLRFASFSAEGLKMLEAARSAAQALERGDPGLAAHPRVKAELEHRLQRGVVFAAESG